MLYSYIHDAAGVIIFSEFLKGQNMHITKVRKLSHQLKTYDLSLQQCCGRTSLVCGLCPYPVTCLLLLTMVSTSQMHRCVLGNAVSTESNTVGGGQNYGEKYQYLHDIWRFFCDFTIEVAVKI